MASAIYTAPRAPKADTRPQLAAGIAVAGAIVFAFVGWMIYLESEKNRSCCGYSWCAPRCSRACPEARCCCWALPRRPCTKHSCVPASPIWEAMSTCLASSGVFRHTRGITQAPAVSAGVGGSDSRRARRGMSAVNDGKGAAKAAKASKPAGGPRAWFNRGKAETVPAGANGADNGNGKLPAYNFDDPKQEVALQPQGASALPAGAPGAVPASGIGRHRLP